MVTTILNRYGRLVDDVRDKDWSYQQRERIDELIHLGRRTISFPRLSRNKRKLTIVYAT